MTLHIPVQEASQTPSASVKTSETPDVHLEKVAKAIARAKRVVVVCGAGISVRAGIPDFRSAEKGLFHTLKKDNPKDGLSSGRDLFDTGVFNSESKAALFYKMIASLAKAAANAEPTPFHRLLKTLDDRGQLIRCYTQNIDALEEKAGLSFGIPLPTQRRSPKKPVASSGAISSASSSQSEAPSAPSTGTIDPIPRCIPLHGTLKHLHCRTCTSITPLQELIHTFEDGSVPPCPQCSEFENTRLLVGKRSRGVGFLRPSIVLYGEEHLEGEGVGETVKKDLTGGKTRRAPPDLLLVVGTSLKVPGTKRIVKEFAKAARVATAAGSNASTPSNESGPATPSTSRKPSPPDGEDTFPMKTIYLNLEFPMPASQWDPVFDVWVQGDVQQFVERVQTAIEVEDELKRTRGEQRSALKRKREGELSFRSTPASATPKKRRRCDVEEEGVDTPTRSSKHPSTPLLTVKDEPRPLSFASRLPFESSEEEKPRIIPLVFPVKAESPPRPVALPVPLVPRPDVSLSVSCGSGIRRQSSYPKILPLTDHQSSTFSASSNGVFSRAHTLPTILPSTISPPRSTLPSFPLPPGALLGAARTSPQRLSLSPPNRLSDSRPRLST